MSNKKSTTALFVLSNWSNIKTKVWLGSLIWKYWLTYNNYEATKTNDAISYGNNNLIKYG